MGSRKQLSNNGRRIPDEKFDEFLSILRAGATVDDAADEAGISTTIIYLRKKLKEGFKARFDKALAARPPRKGRRTHRTSKRTKKLEAKLFELLSNNGGIVTDACQDLGISRVALYNWKKADEKFAVRVAMAVDRGVDRLEDEAKSRALDGNEEPVYYQGKVCGYIRKKSDTLMIFLLKAHRSKYRERQEISGPDGAPLQPFVHIVMPDNGRSDKPPITKVQPRRKGRE